MSTISVYLIAFAEAVIVSKFNHDVSTCEVENG